MPADDVVARLASFSGPHPHNNQPMAGPSRLPAGLRPLYQTATSPRSPWSHNSPPSTHPKLRLPSPHQSPTHSSPSPYAPAASPTHPAQALHPSDSFVVLTDSILGPARGAPPSASPPATTAADAEASALSPRLAQLHEVYSLLGAHSQAEHPLCVECMEMLLVAMQRQLEEARRERDRLVAFEKEVAKRREEGRVGTREEMDRDINKVKN